MRVQLRIMFALCIGAPVLSIPSLVDAQTDTPLESHLATVFEKIGTYYNQVREFRTEPNKSSTYADSLRNESESLRNYLITTLPTTPQSLTKSFTVPEAMWVVSSADHKLRSWAWDTKTGAEKPNIILLIEYATKSGTKVIDLHATNPSHSAPDWYDTIYTVSGSNSQTYYLPFVNSQYSTDDVAQRIDAFSVEGTKLNTSIPLFKQDNTVVHSVGIKYNYFKNYSKALDRERYKIHLSNDLKTLTVPIVVADSATALLQTYSFDGTHYVLQSSKK